MKPVEEIRRANLNLLIEKSGGLTNFCNLIERSDSQVSQWATGAVNSGTGNKRNISPASCRYIEEKTQKQKNWMDYEHDVEEQNITSAAIQKSKIPLISWVQAGNWCGAKADYEVGDAEQWLELTVPHGKHTFALTVKGESMDGPGGYKDGEIIFVDPDLEPTPNTDVVVRMGDSFTFKRLKQDEQGFYLWAINESWIPRMQRIDENCHICGKVIFSQMKR